MDRLARRSLPAAWMIVALVGCQGVSMPNWRQPGTAQHQRALAERYDPYPQNETGPPIDGGRPRDYQKPVPEISRARWLPWNWGGR